MFTLSSSNTDKASHYQELLQQAKALLRGETDWIANTAQFAALLYHSLPDLNWAGFYFYKKDALILGPFQGKPACVHIAMNKGVCGSAAAKRETIIVENVNAFPGHIACDAQSQSEIVLPLIKQQQFLGVLDLDSPILSHFDNTDAQGLTALVGVLLSASTAPVY